MTPLDHDPHLFSKRALLVILQGMRLHRRRTLLRAASNGREDSDDTINGLEPEKIWLQRKQYLAHSEDNIDWEQLA